jgi:pyruvate dehydrogenase E1 component alpha subunit
MTLRATLSQLRVSGNVPRELAMTAAHDSLASVEPLDTARLDDGDAALGDDVVRVLGADGSLGREAFADDAVALLLYRRMVLARHMDERLVALQREGRVAYHTSAIGEEAAVVGSAMALRDQDWLFPGSRDAAAALARGLSPLSYAHHVFGSGADAAKGRQMPEHVTSRSARIVSASPLLGTQLPHAVGLAWAAKGKDVVALAYFGVAATFVGDFHNALNFAGVFRAPVVFVSRSSRDRRHAADSIAAKGVAYGVPGIEVDGSDPFAVYRETLAAVKRAAAGEGATLIDAIVSTVPARDPIARTRRALELRGLWNDVRQSALVADVEAEVAAAIDAAESAPPPATTTLFDDTYAEPSWNLREQRARYLANVKE